MKRKLLYFLLFLLPFCSAAQLRDMTAKEKASFQQALRKLVEVKSLSADFVQYKHLSFMKKPVVSSGKLFLQQPDRLSWVYTAPFQYKMVFKEGQIFINDQGKKQTIQLGGKQQFEKIAKLVSQSMQGQVYDEREFAVAYQKDGSADRIRLTPKLAGAKKYIQEIVLLFSSLDRQVEEVTLIEPSKDYTRFVLKNRKVNTPIDESNFSL